MMNKYVPWLLSAAILLSILSLSFSIYQHIGEPNIAFVESDVLIEKYKKAQESRVKIDKRIQEWESNLKTLQKELQKLDKEMVEQAATWSENIKKKKMAVIKKKRKEYMKYNQAVNEKAQKLEKELMQPVYNSINAQMNTFGKDRGYDIVFGTVSGGNILYGEDAVNVTNEFLNFINSK